MAVIAKLIEAAQATGDKGRRAERRDAESAKFEIVEVLKGADQVAGEKVIEVAYFDDKPVGTEFLDRRRSTARDCLDAARSRSRREATSISPNLMKLPADGSERLLYLMDFLGDKEELLASDSYDEFALAPYSALKAIKDKMPHDELVKRVQDPEVVPQPPPALSDDARRLR